MSFILLCIYLLNDDAAAAIFWFVFQNHQIILLATLPSFIIPYFLLFFYIYLCFCPFVVAKMRKSNEMNKNLCLFDPQAFLIFLSFLSQSFFPPQQSNNFPLKDMVLKINIYWWFSPLFHLIFVFSICNFMQFHAISCKSIFGASLPKVFTINLFVFSVI